MFPLKESLTQEEIGMYGYLKPTTTPDENGYPTPNLWSEETFSTINNLMGTNIETAEIPVDELRYYATEEEAMYFLANNARWPINGYVQEKLRNGVGDIQYYTNSESYINGLLYPTRYLYQTFIMPTEMQEDPLPLAYKIFVGAEKPPPEVSSEASAEPSAEPSGPPPNVDFLKPIEIKNLDGTLAPNEWPEEAMVRVQQQLQNNKVPVPPNPSFLKEWFPFATESEVVFFVKNGQWPINSYVREQLKSESIVIPDMPASEGVPITKQDVIDGFLYPNRLLYMKYLLQLESEQNPKPLAYKVYMGTEVPPKSGCPS